MTNKKQEKLQESIVNVAAQIVHEKHLYYIGLRKSKPSYNQLYKICSEYINLGLQNVKNQFNIDIVPLKNKNAIVIDERIVDIIKPSIVEYAVYEFSFYAIRETKRKYTITASGVIKEGAKDKLHPDFLAHFVNLVQVVNELLEYGCMLALNQLNHTGKLYMDEELLELVKLTAKEQVTNDFENTNNNEQRDALYRKLDTIIGTYIAPDLEMLYSMNTEATEPPMLGIEFIETNDGSDVVEVTLVKNRYEIARTVGNPIDENVVNTICTFIYAVNEVFTAVVNAIIEQTREDLQLV